MYPCVLPRRGCERGMHGRRPSRAALPAVQAVSSRRALRADGMPTTQDRAGGAPRRNARATDRAPATRPVSMEDRERLQWLLARSRRAVRTPRTQVWGITLLHASPLLAASLLALLLGRPDAAVATLGLVLLTLGLVRTITRPRRLAVATVREVSRSR